MHPRILSSVRLRSLRDGLKIKSAGGNLMPHFALNDVFNFSMSLSAFDGVVGCNIGRHGSI